MFLQRKKKRMIVWIETLYIYNSSILYYILQICSVFPSSYIYIIYIRSIVYNRFSRWPEKQYKAISLLVLCWMINWEQMKQKMSFVPQNFEPKKKKERKKHNKKKLSFRAIPQIHTIFCYYCCWWSEWERKWLQQVLCYGFRSRDNIIDPPHHFRSHSSITLRPMFSNWLWPDLTFFTAICCCYYLI